MMRGIVMLLCGTALVAGLACGKYGRPERVTRPAAKTVSSKATAPSELSAADGATSDEEDEPKLRKP